MNEKNSVLVAVTRVRNWDKYFNFMLIFKHVLYRSIFWNVRNWGILECVYNAYVFKLFIRRLNFIRMLFMIVQISLAIILKKKLHDIL